MKKKIVSMLCAMCMVFATPCLAYAGEVTGPSKTNIPTTFTKESTFTVTLPEGINGSSGNTTADFTYSVKGDIAANENVTISITDENTYAPGTQIMLKDSTGKTKGANISINKGSFSHDDINGKTATESGSVSFSGLTAGTWSGVAKFIIGLEQTDVPDATAEEAGLYSGGNMVLSWDEFNERFSNPDLSEDVESDNGMAAKLNSLGATATIDKIVLPDSVTAIGQNQFASCQTLESIIIPGSVASIGEGAFADCTALKSVTLSEGITSIEMNAFANCTDLTSIVLPNSLETLGDSVFISCENLTDVTINGATNMGSTLFDSCTNLKNVTLGDNVTVIGDSSFANSTIASIIIPSSVKTIGETAFNECSNLKSVTLQDGIESIGAAAFISTGITEITVPDSVTTIGDSAFAGINVVHYSGSASGSPWGADSVE